MSVRAEGTVRFVSSYRGNCSYTVGLRRFEVGHEFAGEVHRYWCKTDADAVALSAYLDNERAEFARWAVGRGLSETDLQAHAVKVDFGMWHVLVYGSPAPMSEV